MKILYIGSGFVGACSAAVSADSGHTTLVFDVDSGKVTAFESGDRDAINSYIFEEGLPEILARNKERISFTTEYTKVTKFLDDCDAVFICVPTPEIGETGESDLKYYYSATKELAAGLFKRNNGSQTKYVVIINKSTVPVEMITETEKIMDAAGVKNYGVVSNPEFLVEGKAVEDSVHPDRVVVGAWKEQDFKIMRIVYERFYTSPNIKYIEVNPKEAAAGKLLANFYLFNKLAVCFDVIGRASEAFDNVGFENIRRILTTDPRIGTWGFYDSLYAGGSCFIKDARSLAHQLKSVGENSSLVDETYLANKRQLTTFIERAATEANFNWEGKTVALLGLAFKQDTNDIRNSPSLDIAQFVLLQNVKELRCYDPAAESMFQRVYPAGDVCKYVSESDAVKDADVIIIATDWPQFRELGDTLLKNPKTGTLIMDGRRLLTSRYLELSFAGFDIVAVGSPFIKAKI